MKKEPKPRVDLLQNEEWVIAHSPMLKSLTEEAKKLAPAPVPEPVIVPPQLDEDRISSLIDSIIDGPKSAKLFQALREGYMLTLLKYLQNKQNEYSTLLFFKALITAAYNQVAVVQELMRNLRAIVFPYLLSPNDDLRQTVIELLLTLHDCTAKYSKGDILKGSKELYEVLYMMSCYINEIAEFTAPTIVLPCLKGEIEAMAKSQTPVQLAQEVKQAIEQLGGTVFVKLSSRSPKDAFYPLATELKGEWSKWHLKPDEEPQKLFLKVRELWQIEALFRNSQRIKDDLRDFAAHELILKSWASLGDEFRVFICGGSVTAVSSYPSTILDPVGLRGFFQSSHFADVMGRIPYSQGVVDIALDAHYHIHIIEVNPFGRMSSAALFSWVEDKAVLLGSHSERMYIQDPGEPKAIVAIPPVVKLQSSSK